MTAVARTIRSRAVDAIDSAGIWLVEHGHHRVAVLLWRVSGLW
jgi:hypothetical protein